MLRLALYAYEGVKINSHCYNFKLLIKSDYDSNTRFRLVMTSSPIRFVVSTTAILMG